MSDITYEIIKDYGVLEERKDGWKVHFVKIRWQNQREKFELRCFNGDRVGKLTYLTEEGIQKLQLILKENF